jgi:hypothetical protein
MNGGDLGSLDEACQLPDHSRGVMLWMVDDGCVDFKDTDDGTILIEKQSPYKFQECLALVLHRSYFP